MADAKSVYSHHIVRRTVDETTVELWCGRTRPLSVATQRVPMAAVCDSCRSALAFSCGLVPQ